jgi:hypothetical protein
MFVPPPLLDQYDDGGELFLNELGTLPCPEMVKTAADMTNAVRHESDYALVADTAHGRIYKFPTVDSGNTLLSAMYFEKTAAALPEGMRIKTAQLLAEALTDIGMSPPSYLVKAMEKTAAAEDDNGLYALFERGTHSEEDLIYEFRGMAPPARREAGLMLKQAGVVLPEDLACYGASRLGSDVESCIRLRGQMVSEFRPFVEDMAKAAHVATPEEIAEALYDIDLQFGLTRFYDSKLPDPFQSVYGRTLEKAAMRKEATVTIGGRTYGAEAISLAVSLRGEEIDATFGNGVATQLTMSPVEVLGSLPEPHKLAIARIIDDARAE